MFALSSILLFIISCSVDQKEIMLPGKISIESSQGICSIYDNSDKVNIEFRLEENKQFWHSSLLWLHKEDAFVGIEGLKREPGITYQSNVVLFDSSGNLVERIYESKEGEIAGYAYPSRNDKKLMFLLESMGDIKLNPLEGLNRQQSLVIMDFEQRKVLKRIENFGSSMSIEINESPWLYDEDRLVYTVSGNRKISNEGTDINSVAEGASGIYVYDLNTNQHKLLVPNGRFGICSPIGLQVGYIKDRSVWVLDLKDNTSKMIYEVESNQKITNIHWTPDGKYIYLAYFTNPGTELFTNGERLIEISTSSEIPFKKIRHGFHPYTWK